MARRLTVRPDDVGAGKRNERWVEPFLEANRAQLCRLTLTPEVAYEGEVVLRLKPGERIGAAPLLSAGTRKVVAGVLVAPRFHWSALADVVGRIGFAVEPRIGGRPPGAWVCTRRSSVARRRAGVAPSPGALLRREAADIRGATRGPYIAPWPGRVVGLPTALHRDGPLAPPSLPILGARGRPENTSQRSMDARPDHWLPLVARADLDRPYSSRQRRRAPHYGWPRPSRPTR